MSKPPTDDLDNVVKLDPIIEKLLEELRLLLFPPGPRVCNATDSEYWTVEIDADSTGPFSSVTLTVDGG